MLKNHLSEGKKERPWLMAFADFCGESISTMTDFELSI